MSRAADFERIVLGESIPTPAIISNVDKLWDAIISHASAVPIIPQTPIEKYLAHLIDRGTEIPQPKTRLDNILYAICTNGIIDDYTPLSENEELLYEILVNGELNTSEAEGVVLTLLNSTGDNLVSLDIYGNSVQNGTPTPTSPIPIKNVGDLVTEGEHAGKYAVPIKASGNNLININAAAVSQDIYPEFVIDITDQKVYPNFAPSGYEKTPPIAYSIADNTVNWTTEYAWYGVGFSSPAKPGKRYVASCEYMSEGVMLAITFYKNGVYSRFISTNESAITFTPSTDENGIIVSVRIGTIGSTATVTGIMVCQSDIDQPVTEYEPYQEPITSTLYLDNPLRTSDTLEVVNGKLIQNRAVIQSYNGEDVGDDWISSTGALTTGATVEYTLATPIETDIAGQTIPTFEETTIITLDTETQPENMQCEYYGR